MSLLETIAEWFHGGPPTWECASCGGPVPGDNCGAVCVDHGTTWCLACNAAGRVPDDCGRC